MKTIKVASLLACAVSAVMLGIVFSSTNPVDIGPLGVLMVFCLLYVCVASFLFVLLSGGVAIVARLSGERINALGRRWRVDVRRAYYIASVTAFAPVMLLGLNSVGQLNIQDVVLVGILLSLAIFYIVKRT